MGLDNRGLLHFFQIIFLCFYFLYYEKLLESKDLRLSKNSVNFSAFREKSRQFPSWLVFLKGKRMQDKIYRETN